MKNLLLLHGALGSDAQLQPLCQLLKEDFQVNSLTFSGHGENSSHNEKFSIELFAKEVIEYIILNNLSQVNIFGYSMGGYVGLYLARFFPDRINGVFTLATKFDWSNETGGAEAAMLNPDLMSLKIPSFVEVLEERHGPNWKNVVLKTAGMMLEMGNKNPISEEDFKEISCMVMLGLGDSDKMVTLEETMKINKLIQNCWFLSLEETPHGFEKVNLEVLAERIKLFFK